MTREDVLDADIEACIRFLMADPDRIEKAFDQHRPDTLGLCVSHQEVWPCFVRRLADEAYERTLDELALQESAL